MFFKFPFIFIDSTIKCFLKLYFQKGAWEEEETLIEIQIYTKVFQTKYWE